MDCHGNKHGIKHVLQAHTLQFSFWPLVYPWGDIGLQRSHICCLIPWEIDSECSHLVLPVRTISLSQPRKKDK